ncbi:MAG: hypothetical protein WB384_07185 [Candidatus Sulfotelmatobacter sp.]
MMPNVTWVRTEFVQTTGYGLAVNVVQLLSIFTWQRDLTRIRALHHRPAPRVRELRLVEGNSRLRSHSSTASRRYRVVRPILVGGGPSPLRAMRSIVRVLRRNCSASWFFVK